MLVRKHEKHAVRTSILKDLLRWKLLPCEKGATNSSPRGPRW